MSDLFTPFRELFESVFAFFQDNVFGQLMTLLQDLFSNGLPQG